MATHPQAPAEIDNAEREKRRSPAFREALRKDDERERQSGFRKDRNIWGRTGAGPDVPKTDPQDSQKREEGRARREEGYD